MVRFMIQKAVMDQSPLYGQKGTDGSCLEMAHGESIEKENKISLFQGNELFQAKGGEDRNLLEDEGDRSSGTKN
jgi:hypothetical protein